MTRLEALKELAAKVEAGDWGVEASRAARTASPGMNDTMWSAYCGDLNAALSLHEAVLPDAWAHIRHTGQYGHCTIDLDGEEYEADNQPNPARAWLLAILGALIAQEQAND